MSDAARPAPYPSDTRAKGWRFEIDVERIEQSDTWTLAPADVRPWLLMLWMTAWKQAPCGSLTNDDMLIAARIGMPAKLFAKHRAILMRGWWLADDGRLYHAALSEHVEAMLVKREKDAGRTAARRAKQSGHDATPKEVAPVSRVTPSGQDEDSTVSSTPSTKHQAPEPPKPPSGVERRFEAFWAEYPKKIGKDAAAKAFAKRKPDDALLAVMVEAVALQRDSNAWRKDGGQFIPNPATWLNQGRWQDEGADGDGAQFGLMAGAI